MNELFAKLEAEGLIENEMIILERYPEGSIQAVDKETFNGFFGQTDGSYTALVKVGEPLGYKPFFDKWKELNIL